MKKKASKGGNGNGEKREASTGAVDLLRMTAHLSGLVRKAEGSWKAKCRKQAKALINKSLKATGEKGKLMFQTVQMAHEAGAMDDNMTLYMFYFTFVHMNDEEMKSIPDQPDIRAKIDKICESINLKSKKDRKSKGREIMRYQFASVLRHFGEYQTADLVLNDPQTFNRRSKEGALLFWKNDPDVNLDDDFFKTVAL